MAGLQFLTASYRNDLVPFEDLHRSILRYGPEDAMHLVVVPDCDLPLFARFGGERTLVRPVSAYLPRPLLSVTGATQWFRGVPGLSSLARIDAINPFRPYPPVRGWIRQQITKLAAAAASDAEAVVIVDSDVSLVRPVTSDTFVRDGVVRFYRLPEGITPDMRRHRRWVEIAAGLLDIPAPQGALETDYIASFVSWDPTIVRRLLARIEANGRGGWAAQLAAQIEFSECILYGLHLDMLGSERERSFAANETRCHSHWDPVPLSEGDAAAFLAGMSPEDVAVHIQSNSHTTEQLRRRLIATAQA